MDHEAVYRPSPGTKLNAAVLGTRVVFEVDNASPGWSVLAHEIREAAELVHAEALLGHDWPAGEREHYVRIVSEQVTGRRLPSSA